MIEWWWLVIKAVALIAFGTYSRGCTRAAALIDALTEPEKARRELERRGILH